MHIYIHTYIHTYMHIYIPTYIHTFLYTYSLNMNYPYRIFFSFTYIHTCIKIHTHAHLHIYIHTSFSNMSRMWFISFDESPLLLRFLPWVIERTDLVGKADDDEASVYDDAVISMTAKCLLMFDIHVKSLLLPFSFHW